MNSKYSKLDTTPRYLACTWFYPYSIDRHQLSRNMVLKADGFRDEQPLVVFLFKGEGKKIIQIKKQIDEGKNPQKMLLSTYYSDGQISKVYHLGLFQWGP